MNDLFEAPETTEASEREELLTKWKDKSKEELLEAKINSDLFIKTLTKRQDDISKDYLETKKQLEAQASLQELVDRLNQKTTSNSDTTPANEDIESRFKLEDVDARAQLVYEKARKQERATANATLVQSKLKEHFGNSYQAVLRDTGLSDQRINELAMESPEAVFRLVGLNDRREETFQSPPRSNQRQSNFSPKGQTKRDWNYYMELKKTNPKIYLDPKIANQMHDDAIALGADFGMPTD